MIQWIFIESFHNEIEATIATGQLEAHDIRCQTRLNPNSDVLLGIFGVQNGPRDLFVNVEDAEKAKAILNGK